VHPLDNPVWHALRGPQAAVAERNGRALRYRTDRAPFAAVDDEPTAGDWEDLGALVGVGSMAVLFRNRVPARSGWTEVFRLPTDQLVAPSSVAGERAAAAVELGADVVEQAPDVVELGVEAVEKTREAVEQAPDVVELGADDHAEVRRLVASTDPGPFARRTLELGTYLGIRAGGELVALAGERMRLRGHTEISLVCTHPDHRGRGLAARLVADLVSRIRARDEVPFLHVVEGNPALGLYLAMGFEIRRRVEVVGLAWES
jgi:ribosomal protein S18 acetylase RimI-like enzyme